MELRPEQKAAALIIGVGPELGARLIEFLDDEEVEHLAAEVANLERVDPDLLERVIDEVRVEAAQASAVASGGLGYVRKLLSGWKAGRGSEILDDLESGPQATPFRFMRDLSADLVIRVLEKEHPQLIAVVMSNQPPSTAARLMSALDDRLRADVALRVARMETPAVWAVEIANEVLQERLGTPSDTTRRTRYAGVRGLAKVLSSAEHSLEQTVLESLARHDPDLADQVRALMFVFEDLITLDDRSVQRVLSEVDTTTLAVALKGAAEDVAEKIFRNMSQRARDRLEEELDLLGPLPRKDVESAREKISSTVLDLGEQGEIMLKRGADAELVG
jgi:flagellar motor switch protein FliG